MSLNNTPSGDRIHIAFFGKRNAGKSSLVNAVTGQTLSVVSDVLGTTTDPVKKAMELLPIGPVVIIDTPGFDDEGALGSLRVEKTNETLSKTDIAVLVTGNELDKTEQEFLKMLKGRKLPVIVAHNKSDTLKDIPKGDSENIWVSAKNGINITELKEMLGQKAKLKESNKKIVADLLDKGDTVILVCPIDEAAPKGRLILPQQQTIRDILDAGCMAFVCQDTELEATLNSLAKPPKMVITDSQAFGRVSKIVPENIPLTSFSILFARYKGDLTELVKGAAMLSKLKDGDKVLISEGCTHHRQCNDIGKVKIPGWIEDFSGAKPEFKFTSGGQYPTDLSGYKLAVHCGGCMLNEAEMKHRIETARSFNVPIVNYGVSIAHIHNILKRSLSLFPEVKALLEE